MLKQFKPSGQETKIENWKTRQIWFHFWFFVGDGIVALFNLYACYVVVVFCILIVLFRWTSCVRLRFIQMI